MKRTEGERIDRYIEFGCHRSFTNLYFTKELFTFLQGGFFVLFFFFLEKSDERFDTNQIHKSDTEAELKKVKTLQLDSCS